MMNDSDSDGYVPQCDAGGDGGLVIDERQPIVDEAVINQVAEEGSNPMAGWTEDEMVILDDEIKRLKRLPHAVVLQTTLQNNGFYKTVEQVQSLLIYLQQLNADEQISNDQGYDESGYNKAVPVRPQPGDPPKIDSLINWTDWMKEIQEQRNTPVDLSCEALGKAISSFAQTLKGKSQVYEKGRQRCFLDYHRIYKHLSAYITGTAFKSIQELNPLESAVLLEVLKEIDAENRESGPQGLVLHEIASSIETKNTIQISKAPAAQDETDPLCDASVNPLGISDEIMDIKFSEKKKTAKRGRKPSNNTVKKELKKEIK